MPTLPRTSLVFVAAAVTVAATSATAALAEPPPPAFSEQAKGPTFEPIVPRANVAALGSLASLPVAPRFGWGWGSSYDSSPPLRTTGIVVVSLGVATMFGAGVSAIVAAASTTNLADDCPGGRCVEGTPGGRAYSRAVDAATAADWLIGIGMPIVASGTVMLIYSAVLERNSARAWPTTVLRASPSGATLAVHF